jgi:hypothetical protein
MMEKFLMLFINDVLQVIELKRGEHKKGRVWLRRALNQQSFGNCESWNFIVGKKYRLHSPKFGTDGSLQPDNS